MKRPSVLIADDHKMFTQGLAGLLEDDFDLVGTVADGQTLLIEAARLKPDVILVDISMPILNGLDAVRRLGPDASKVIFLTMHADSRLFAEAFRCGGLGYVLKQSAGEDLIFAIHQVLAGHKYVSPIIEQELDRVPNAEINEKHGVKLTPRQREVLLLLSEGCTMKQIAGRLGISSRTAETYKYGMMSELGVETTAELIQLAVKLGLTKT